MADVKVSALTTLAGSLADVDLFHVVDDPTGTPLSRKVTALSIKNYATGSAGTIWTQDANNVSISGGDIDDVVIGATTPVNGTFTALRAVTNLRVGSSSVLLNDTTGSDTNIVSGTAGTSGNLVQWNADGDAVDSSIVAGNVVVDSDITNMVESDTTGVTGADAITNIISLTQAEYDAITPDSATLYVITS